ncbi:flagellar FliJ family protein [Cellulomonas sp. PhB150]|uniref:flagellar FliJ family protein n=1 Tax=Cellulomonas sp. PhB150 TaxID=2485188 RepID=UPI000F475504|nr:flagellar FliJ family protein [Cellulomonas sp. PhB150]ROS25781.1 flagellar FliJ protein [Cellulomonas sp. PhB150]
MTRAFPLAGLLRMRGRAEEQAVADLATARRDEARAADLRRATAAALAGAGMPATGDDIAWMAAVASRSTLAALLSERDHQLGRAAETVQDCSEAWSVARRDARALELLEERHVATERAEELHAEQVVLDEVAARGAAPARIGATS